MEYGPTGTEQMLGAVNSSNEMIPVLKIVGTQEKINPLSQNIVRRDPEMKSQFKGYLESLFQDLSMRDNGGKETKIDHYHFLKVNYFSPDLPLVQSTSFLSFFKAF